MKAINELDFPAQTERFFQGRGLRAEGKFLYRGITVYLAEGGPYHERNEEFPSGWYESAYAMLFANPQTGKHLSFIMPMAFDFNHDPQIGGQNTRKRARAASAKRAAILHIDELYKTWLGDALTLVS